MFEESNLLALMQSKSDNGEIEIRHISLNEETRVKIMAMFSDNATDLTRCKDGSQKTSQPFHADYTAQPESDEYIEIEQFSMPKEISRAVADPLALETYVPNSESLPLIRALFASEQASDGSFRMAFQRFRSAQYLKASSIHIMYSGNTLTAEGSGLWSKLNNRVGLSVWPSVDVLFEDGSLKFVSQYFAKQVLDLTEYYREASKPDLEDFVALPNLAVEDPGYIVNSSDSWEKRKIASIRSARIIEEHALDEMLGHASQIKYKLPVANGKLLIPSDKKERKKLLAFLDEDVYRGMFTDSIYQTNSKRSL